VGERGAVKSPEGVGTKLVNYITTGVIYECQIGLQNIPTETPGYSQETLVMYLENNTGQDEENMKLEFSGNGRDALVHFTTAQRAGLLLF